MLSNESHSGDASESPPQRAEMLHETQDYLALVTDATQIGIFDWNMLTDEVVWTRQHEIILGYAPTTATIATHAYRDWADRVHPDDLPQVVELIRRGMAERTFQKAEYRVIWPDGSLHWILGQGRAYYNDEGRAIRMLGAIQDITERKRAEEALRQSEYRRRAVLDTIPDPAWLKDKEGRVLAVNSAWCRFFGMDAQNVTGKTVFELLPTEFAERLANTDRTVIESRHPLRLEETLKDKNGNLVWFETIKNPLFDDQGELVGTVGLARDITERKQTEERSLAIKAKLEAALASTADAVFISDVEGEFVDFNDAFATFNRFRNKDECSAVCSEYHDILDLFMANGEPAPPDQWPVPRALRGEVVTNVEYALRRKDTGETWVGSFSFAPIRDRDSTIVGAVVSARDITERKRAEEALQEMRVQLAHAARLSTLGEMVAELTHELNHPLYAILNFSKASSNVLTEEGPTDLGRLREWNEKIAQIALSAAEVVKRLRAFSRRADLPRTECRIDEIVEEALKLISIETERNQVTVEAFPAADAPRVQVDRVQVQQVLVNLITNAVEAMLTSPVEMRRITIRTLLHATDVEITVADRGIGLPPGSETKIFKPFVTTKPNGLGMGLSIIRTIVEGHGGKVWASPNYGGGVFFISRFLLLMEPHPYDV